jgi:hypothetical protein
MGSFPLVLITLRWSLAENDTKKARMVCIQCRLSHWGNAFSCRGKAFVTSCFLRTWKTTSLLLSDKGESGHKLKWIFYLLTFLFFVGAKQVKEITILYYLFEFKWIRIDDCEKLFMRPTWLNKLLGNLILIWSRKFDKWSLKTIYLNVSLFQLNINFLLVLNNHS